MPNKKDLPTKDEVIPDVNLPDKSNLPSKEELLDKTDLPKKEDLLGKTELPNKNDLLNTLDLPDKSDLKEEVHKLKSSVVSKKPSFSKKFDFSGTLELGADYNYCDNSTYNFPQSAAWINLQPEVNAFGIPLGGQILFSTDNSAYRQNINMFNFHFDGNRLKENVKKILAEKMNNLIKENEVTDLYKSANLGELANIDNILKNPEVQKELNLLNNLDSLTRRLKYTYNVKTDEAVDSLKNALGINKELEAKRKSYDRLFERKDELDSLNRIYKAKDSLCKLVKYAEDKLNDVQTLVKKAKNLTNISDLAKILLNVENLQIGTCFPNYSDLSMMNQPIRGVAIELIPSNIYISFAYGKLNKAINGFDTMNNCYKRNSISFGLGYGRQNSSHFRIRYLSFSDNPQSLPSDDISTVFLSPQANKVLNLSGRVDIIKKVFNIEAEISGAETIKNTELQISPEIYVDSVPYNAERNANNWLINILTQKNANFNTFVDYAYKIKSNINLFKGNTAISLTVRRVGPYFQSFGLPFLMKDLMTYEAKVKQNIYKRRIYLSVGANYNTNNLNHENYFTSKFLRLNIEAGIKFPKFPSLTIAYKPVFLRNDTMFYTVNTYNANILYSYKTNKIRHSTSINGFFQQCSGSNDMLHYQALFLTLNHTTFLTNDIALNIGVSDLSMQRTDSTLNNLTSSLSSTFTIKHRVTNTAGINYVFSKADQKFGFFYDVSVSFAKILSFRLRLGTNTYDSDYFYGERNYNQFTLRSILTAKL